MSRLPPVSPIWFVLVACGGGSQVYLRDTDQPIAEPGERIGAVEQPPPRSRGRRHGPAMYTLHLENACDEPARLFLGQAREDPNGKEIVLGPGESATQSGFVPARLYLLDVGEPEAPEYDAEAGSQTVSVARSCNEIERRD